MGAAWRVAGPLGIVGTADGEAGDRRLRIGAAFSAHSGIIGDRRLEYAFRLARMVGEHHLNKMGARLCGEAQFEILVRIHQIAFVHALTKGAWLRFFLPL